MMIRFAPSPALAGALAAFAALGPIGRRRRYGVDALALDDAVFALIAADGDADVGVFFRADAALAGEMAAAGARPFVGAPRMKAPAFTFWRAPVDIAALQGDALAQALDWGRRAAAVAQSARGAP